MAKRAKSGESGGTVEGAIGGFAEDLGRILGQARNKADSWLGQRQAIVKQLTQLRDEATSLLNQLGHQAAAAGRRGRRVADSFVAGYQKRGPGRPKGSKKERDHHHWWQATSAEDVSSRSLGYFESSESAVGEAEGSQMTTNRWFKRI